MVDNRFTGQVGNLPEIVDSVPNFVDIFLKVLTLAQAEPKTRGQVPVSHKIMKTEIKIFTSDIFGEIRTCQVNNQIMFVGKDVATALGYSNSQKAIRDHVDDDDKLTERFVLSGQARSVIIINESGLYSLKGEKKIHTYMTWTLNGLRFLNSKLGYPNF